MTVNTDRIRLLNDKLRKHLLGGGAVMTPGIAALGSKTVQRIVQAIATFDDFCSANDPYEEHDFGEFDFDGVRIIFKIDYFRGRETLNHVVRVNPIGSAKVIGSTTSSLRCPPSTVATNN